MRDREKVCFMISFLKKLYYFAIRILSSNTNVNNRFNGVENLNSDILCEKNVSNTIVNNNLSINNPTIVGMNNVRELTIILDQECQKNNVDKDYIHSELENPEKQMAVKNALKTVYATNDPDKRKILADLIYSKIATKEDEESNTLSIAISIIKFFTINHLKAISLLYLIFIKYIDQFLTEEKFDKFYESKLSNLLSYSTNDLVGLEMTIISQGAATMVGMRYTLPCQITINELKNKDVLNQDALDKIAICWNKFGAGSIQLTPAGECLAKRYLFDVLGISV